MKITNEQSLFFKMFVADFSKIERYNFNGKRFGIRYLGNEFSTEKDTIIYHFIQIVLNEHYYLTEEEVELYVEEDPGRI